MKNKASDVEIAIPLLYDRNFPPSAWVEAAKTLEASGVVDFLQTWDQLTSWFPKSMWTVENTPLAAMMPDCDSFSDAFTMGVYAHAAAPGLGTVISTDAIRTGPAELTQKMMTITDLTEGRSAIRIRVVFTPRDIPLFPGRPLDERAWSEIRYDVYCFEMPD